MKLMTKTMILTSFFMASTAVADRWHRERGHLKKVLRQLDLSDEQRATIKKSRKTNKEDFDKQRQQMRAAEEAFHKGMRDMNLSDSELRNLHKSFVEQRMNHMKSKFEKMMIIRSVLTPVQKQKFVELNKNYRPKHDRVRKRHRD
jgi:periplasmic protein CpxP/Spy